MLPPLPATGELPAALTVPPLPGVVDVPPVGAPGGRPPEPPTVVLIAPPVEDPPRSPLPPESALQLDTARATAEEPNRSDTNLLATDVGRWLTPPILHHTYK